MSYLDKATQDQSLNGIITLTDGFIEISNGDISGLTDLDLSGNLTVGNDVLIDHNITIQNDAVINNDLTVTGSLSVGGVVENFDTVINNKTSSNYNQSRYINNKTINNNNINCTNIINQNLTTKNIKCKKINTDKLIIKQVKPINSTDTGQIGEIRFDSDYIYVCIGANSWKRVQINLF